ncbi:MAG: hypothetical protein WCF85_17890, partial [Rhodospirillaceae bacterium]
LLLGIGLLHEDFLRLVLLKTAHALSGGAGCYGLIALSSGARFIENSVNTATAESLSRAIAEIAGLLAGSLAEVAHWHARWLAERASNGHP